MIEAGCPHRIAPGIRPVPGPSWLTRLLPRGTRRTDMSRILNARLTLGHALILGVIGVVLAVGGSTLAAQRDGGFPAGTIHLSSAASTNTINIPFNAPPTKVLSAPFNVPAG